MRKYQRFCVALLLLCISFIAWGEPGEDLPSVAEINPIAKIVDANSPALWSVINGKEHTVLVRINSEQVVSWQFTADAQIPYWQRSHVIKITMPEKQSLFFQSISFGGGELYPGGGTLLEDADGRLSLLFSAQLESNYGYMEFPSYPFYAVSSLFKVPAANQPAPTTVILRRSTLSDPLQAEGLLPLVEGGENLLIERPELFQLYGPMSVSWVRQIANQQWFSLSRSGHLLKIITAEDKEGRQQVRLLGGIDGIAKMELMKLDDTWGHRSPHCLGAGELTPDGEFPVLCVKCLPEEWRYRGYIYKVQVSKDWKITSKLLSEVELGSDPSQIKMLSVSAAKPMELRWCYIDETKEQSRQLVVVTYLPDEGITKKSFSFFEIGDVQGGFVDVEEKYHLFFTQQLRKSPFADLYEAIW